MDIREKILNGLPIDDIRIIDCHDHMGRWNAFYIPQDGTADQMVASMDRYGIDQVFATAHSAIGPDYIHGNDMIAAACDKYPDRIWGYCTVNPNHMDDMKNELARCFANPGFKGIKFHPACHGRAISDKNYTPALEYADDKKLPILIHVWGAGDVSQVDKLAEAYPNTRFIMGHSGADLYGISLAIDVMNKRDNVYGDTALSTAMQGQIEWLVKEANPKKIVFGSDMPFYDPAPTVGRIALADIPFETKIDIFGRNMAEAMGIKY